MHGSDIAHLLGLGGTGNESTTVAQFTKAMEDAALSNGGVLNAASLAPQLAKYNNHISALRRNDGRDAIAPTTHALLFMHKLMQTRGQNPTWLSTNELKLLEDSAKADIMNVIQQQRTAYAATAASSRTSPTVNSHVAKYLHDNKYDVTRYTALNNSYGYYTPATTGGGTAGGGAGGTVGGGSTPVAGGTAATLTTIQTLSNLFSASRHRPIKVPNNRNPTQNNFFETYGNTTVHHT